MTAPTMNPSELNTTVVVIHTPVAPQVSEPVHGWPVLANHSIHPASEGAR